MLDIAIENIHLLVIICEISIQALNSENKISLKLVRILP